MSEEQAIWLNDPEIKKLYLKRVEDLNPVQKNVLDTALKKHKDPAQILQIISIANRLNPEQMEAMLHDHDTAGPLLIFAGAGSGKTTALTYRIIYLILTGVNPQNILALTFTVKAAEEMRSRIRKFFHLIKDKMPEDRFSFLEVQISKMWVGTFHSICLKMLKDETVEENGRIIINCDRLGLPVGFGILENPYSILKVCFESEFAGDPNIKYDTVASKIEHWKNELMAINTIRDKASREEKKFIPVYEKYQNTLKQKGLIDFNDMIMLVVELFEKCPEILFRYRRRFKYVLVDEYQDTNYAQYKFCKYIVGDSKNYFVVGDDDQSIYEWRGADIRNILFFEQDYPGCKTIKLVKNYRSTANIIYAANEVFKSVKPKHLVKQIEPVKKKADGSEERGDTITLYTAEDDTDEINFIVFEMNELKTKFCDLKWNDFAVLYRSHEQSKIVKRIFEERKIPYIVYNPYFWQRKEIQDVCSYLHVLKFYLNWRSGNLSGQRLELAGFAVNNHIRRLYYLPPLSFSSIENEVMSHIFDPYKLFTEDRVLESMLNRLDGTKSRDNFLMLIEIFSDIASVSSSSSISLAVEDILTRAGYMDIYTKNINPTAQDRESARCLAALKEEAADFERTRGVGLSLIEQIDSFLDSASIRSSPTEQAGLKSSDDAVNLMSLHAAKGLEFGTVFFIGLEEGIIPMQHFSAEKLSKKEKQKRLDEERRLFYVGITRAKERLYLTCATRRSWYGKQKMFEQSRFLKCIPKELLEKGSFRTRLSDKIKHFVVSFFK